MLDSEEITVPGLSSRLQEMLFLFQQKRYLCDVMIVAANGYIPAHRVVLVAGSQYFHDVEAARNNLNPTEVNFHLSYDIEDVRKILNLLYTGKMTVTKFNVDRLAAICNELKITEAAEKCLMFMVKVGLSNNVAAGSGDLTESTAGNQELTNDGANSNDFGETVNTSYTEVNIGENTVEHSTLKRKISSVDESSEKEKGRKKPKRAYNRKEKKTKTSQTKISDDQCKEHDPRESVITIQPFSPSKDNKNTGDSISDQQHERIIISENSQSDPNSAREETSIKEEASTDAGSCMYLDFNELHVYQSQAPLEKITKQFDPDGAITEALEKDQEFLGQVEKRLYCRTCKVTFKDVDSFTQHRREKHPSNFKKQRFVCDICNAKPNNHVTLVEHKFKKHGIAYDPSKYPKYKCPEEVCI